jgi:MMP 1-O-methyltransferase
VGCFARGNEEGTPFSHRETSSRLGLIQSDMKLIDTDLDAVDGWLNPKEARLLFELARECAGRGAIVEIGSWKGKSTICLGHGSRAGNGATVHAIDPHTGSPEHSEMFGKVWTFEEFRRNIDRAGLNDLVEPHVDFSTAVAKTFREPVDLIFIDGLHEYEGVRDDFEAWYPRVVEGGTMAFHDTTCWPGVLKLVTEALFKSRHFRKVRFARSIVYGRKVAQNTFLERLENRLVLCAFLTHALMDRWQWRLIHHYLDFPITRAIVGHIKKRQAKATGLPAQR